MEPFAYDAFISYSHRDLAWGAWLQRRLETRRIPRDLRPAWMEGRVRLRVFRDQTDLAGVELSESLQKALTSARFLIVVCSPASAASPWVEREVRFFRALGRERQIIPFVVSGEPESDDPGLECYVPALRDAPGSHFLGASVPELGRGKAFLRALAILLDVRFGRLVDREKRRRRVLALRAGIAAAAVGGVLAFLLVRNAAVTRRNQALSYDMYGAAVVGMVSPDEADASSLEALRVAAEAGNPQAMWSLADLLIRGAGGEKDEEAAYAWYLRAADLGDAVGMEGAANCLLNGVGAEKDEAAACAWYLRAAEAGNAHAMFMAGACSEDGIGTEKDEAAAYAWYLRAADAGYGLAWYHLSRCCLLGIGTPADPAASFANMRRFAETGDPEGMYNLAMMLQRGFGTEEDPEAAYAWYRKAADAGDARAMYWTGWCVENGYGVSDPALEWYEKAAAAGSEEGREAVLRLTGGGAPAP